VIHLLRLESVKYSPRPGFNFGLSEPELKILRAVLFEPKTSYEMRRDDNIPQSSALQLSKKLVKGGYLTWVNDPNGKLRRIRYSITWLGIFEVIRYIKNPTDMEKILPLLKKEERFKSQLWNYLFSKYLDNSKVRRFVWNASSDLEVLTTLLGDLEEEPITREQYKKQYDGHPELFDDLGFKKLSYEKVNELIEKDKKIALDVLVNCRGHFIDKLTEYRKETIDKQIALLDSLTVTNAPPNAP